MGLASSIVIGSYLRDRAKACHLPCHVVVARSTQLSWRVAVRDRLPFFVQAGSCPETGTHFSGSCSMRRLMLLRHAKTERTSTSGQDRDRQLDERGRIEAPEMGRYM